MSILGQLNTILLSPISLARALVACVLFALVLDLASEPSLSPDLVSEALAPVDETCVIEL